MTQPLVTSALLRPRVEKLQLRLGTNCTPEPFFHRALLPSALRLPSSDQCEESLTQHGKHFDSLTQTARLRP
jgi:hypothetical protein